MNTPSVTLQKLVEAWERMSASEMRLHCGEMTAQEIRTVRAVLRSILSTNNQPKQEIGRGGKRIWLEIVHCLKCPYSGPDINELRTECKKANGRTIFWNCDQIEKQDAYIPDWCPLSNV